MPAETNNNFNGNDSGNTLYSTTPLSFWGGISPTTSQIIDTTHPLHGHFIAHKIVCIPSGRGSCTGSQVMLELILNDLAPFAVVLRDVDSILCTGAIIAEEFFGEELDLLTSPLDAAAVAAKTTLYDYDENESGNANRSRKRKLPIIVAVGGANFARLHGHSSLSIHDDDEGTVCITSGDLTIRTPNLLKLPNTLSWGEYDDPTKFTLSPAEIVAKRTISRIASVSSSLPPSATAVSSGGSATTTTTSVIPITSAHIDAVTYIGQGGLKFVQKLVESGARVKVTTTLNSQSCDRRNWSTLGVDATLAHNSNAVGDAYLQLGCEERSFTCAPYLLPTRPTLGDNIIWGESNAVVYSNSVIGARTEKYADYFDILAAIVGYVPNVGVHVDENRVPTMVIDATRIIEEDVLPIIAKDGINNDSKTDVDLLHYMDEVDSFFPVMGWICGNLSGGAVPLILGFDRLDEVTDDNLKAFCAAFGTTGTAPLFHMANITPEAMGDDRVNSMLNSCGDKRVEVTMDMLRKSYMTLDSGNDGNDDVSLVALGNPHLSVKELGLLSNLIEQDDRPKHTDVKVIATLGRHVQSEGETLGYIQKLQSFGMTFINDTCWCMLLDPPIIPTRPDAKILTNSGKYAHYGPGLTNRKIRFGSMHQCIEVAKRGQMVNSSMDGGRSITNLPRWLRTFSTQSITRFMKHVK